jgi:anti-anti-sigma factor
MVVDETADTIREEVSRRLPNAVGAGLVLDCSAVELINSIGITCLLQVQDHCRRAGAPMFLAAMPGPIQLFLRQLKLDRRFQSEPTVDDAVKRIGLSGRDSVG